MCTLPERRDLPNLRKKEQELQGGSSAGQRVWEGAGVSGTPSGDVGAGAALRGWVAVVAEQKSGPGRFWLRDLRESQATSGPTGSSGQSCCGNASLSGSVSSPLTLLRFCSLPIN